VSSRTSWPEDGLFANEGSPYTDVRRSNSRSQISKHAMDNQKLVAEWQTKIVTCCEVKLGRQLSSAELGSIKRFGGFQALELIEDTINHAQPNEVERYLASIAAQ